MEVRYRHGLPGGTSRLCGATLFRGLKPPIRLQFDEKRQAIRIRFRFTGFHGSRPEARKFIAWNNLRKVSTSPFPVGTEV